MSARTEAHPPAAARFLDDGAHAAWHDAALWNVRDRRDKAAASVPDWERLREQATRIKQHTLAHLPDYLEQFERAARAAGATVHWAKDPEEFRVLVHGLLKQHGVTSVAKSKSMLTEECALNPYLEAQGIEVVDTDLGERVVQLNQEHPSHIVLPAIHLNKQQIGRIFEKNLGTAPGNDSAEELTEAARQDLRARYLHAQAGITGVNFAVAETGTLVVCTNEANADLGMTVPKLHIACMGLEKLVPRFEDLAVFTRLLARSGTGQAITAYTSHVTGPAPGSELHIVLLDNGRSALLARDRFRNALKCIRCGACMNTCPVFRRSGGHSYNHVIPGPIGSVLAPNVAFEQTETLPFASSLCGSCTEVCPVKIDLHKQLLYWREELAKEGRVPLSKQLGAHVFTFVATRPWLFKLGGRMMRLSLRITPRALVYGPWNAWGKRRELPVPPKRSYLDGGRP
ncbi:MAG: 4Fe-4S dicluster domain-containing protein [Candidatus Hydrogenedens sp.]|nr:4Fe-4S dicluster domain-containing protein [Candidatus Hydrogenedens sp.]